MPEHKPGPNEFHPPPAPPEVIPEAFLCRIHNPSQRARVLYAGAKSDVILHIPAGHTTEAVLCDPLIETLMAQESIDPEEPGLHVTELGPPPPPVVAPPAARPSRRPRPARTSATIIP